MNNTPGSWPIDVFCVVPAYRAADSLAKLLLRLTTVIPPNHICVVDDGSGDTTSDVCKNFHVICRVHSHNRGKGRALITGFEYCLSRNASWILTMDADGQHSVDDINLFLASISKNPTAGLIIGARKFSPAGMPVERIFSNTLTSAFLSLVTGVRIKDSQCGYRAYSASLLRQVQCRRERFDMETEIILKACAHKFPVLFIPVRTLYFNRMSHISHITDTFRWISAVFSVRLELFREKPCPRS